MLERFEVSLIARSIRSPLGFPEAGVCRRHHPSIPALMHVKEAAVNIDDLPMPNKNQVRFTGETLLVKRIAITHSMNN